MSFILSQNPQLSLQRIEWETGPSGTEASGQRLGSSVRPEFPRSVWWHSRHPLPFCKRWARRRHSFWRKRWAIAMFLVEKDFRRFIHMYACQNISDKWYVLLWRVKIDFKRSIFNTSISAWLHCFCTLNVHLHMYDSYCCLDWWIFSNFFKDWINCMYARFWQVNWMENNFECIIVSCWLSWQPLKVWQVHCLGGGGIFYKRAWHFYGFHVCISKFGIPTKVDNKRMGLTMK